MSNMIKKIKPVAKIEESYGDDGRAPRKVWIDYYCPTCGRYIGSWKKDTACDKCGTFYDWSGKEPKIKTTETIEW